MARLQSITQQHFLERQASPLSSRMITGLSGYQEGVPKMHPLKSSMPILKASSMIHGLRMRRPRIGMPRLSGMMRLPKL